MAKTKSTELVLVSVRIPKKLKRKIYMWAASEEVTIQEASTELLTLGYQERTNVRYED